MKEDIQSAWKLNVLGTSFELGSVVISFLALFIAGGSLLVAWQARNDVRDIERLDKEPRISFSAALFPQRYGHLKDLGEKGTSYFTIANFGPVDALQVTVQFLDICFDKEKKTVGSYSTRPKLKTIVGTVEPYERKQINLAQDEVDALADCHDAPPNDSAVLAWISYKRDPDRKTFITRALYFVDRRGYLITDSMGMSDNQGPTLGDEYYDVYSDLIIDYSDTLGNLLEEDEWHAIHPLDIEKRAKTIYHPRL